MRFVSFTLIFILFVSGQALLARSAQLRKFQKTASPAVALVCSQNKEGKEKCSSGFFISPNGFLVTTLHVLDGHRRVFIRGYRWQKAMEAKVVMCYPDVHLALLRPKKVLLEDHPYLGLLPPESVAPGTNCLILSGHDEQAGRQYFRENALGGQTDPWQVLRHPRRDRFSMVALELLEPFPMLATGAPCFDRRGRVLGMTSFFHDFKTSPPKMLFHVIPADYLRDLMACAAHPDIKELHRDRAQELATVVQRAERKAPLSYRVAAMKRRRRLRQIVAQSVKDDKRGLLKEMRNKLKGRDWYEKSKELKSEDKRFARLPQHVQLLRAQHGWDFETLEAIADEKPKTGMTADQIVAMFGAPERVIEGGEKHADGRAFDVWEYKRPMLLSFDGKGKLVSVR